MPKILKILNTYKYSSSVLVHSTTPAPPIPPSRLSAATPGSSISITSQSAVPASPRLCLNYCKLTVLFYEFFSHFRQIIPFLND